MIPEGQVKLLFHLDPADWHGSAAETMWAEGAIADSKKRALRLLNSPFYARGVNYQDLVLAKLSDDGLMLEFTEVVQRGGHSTYMLLRPEHAPAFDKSWAKLAELGCTYEGGGRHALESGAYDLYSVDVPPEAAMRRVQQLLQEGYSAGAWLFQEGHCARGVS